MSIWFRKIFQKANERNGFPYKRVLSFDNVVLGESLVVEPQTLCNRIIAVNLATLKKDLKQQNITLSFKINEVVDDKGIADLIGYTLSPPAVKRLVSKKGDRIDAVFSCTTADGHTITLKPLIITSFSTHNTTNRLLRNAVIESFTESAKQLTYPELAQSIINRKIAS